MKALFYLTVTAVLLTTAAPAAAKKSRPHPKQAKEQKIDPRQIEAATRLQIFLDRANFSPGVINGRHDELTLKALALYRQANGQPPAPLGKPDSAPDVTGLDLASFGPAFVPYTVTDADVQTIGPVPSTPAAQAKVKFLPYRDAAEAIAEKFHCDVHFLEQLNPGKQKQLSRAISSWSQTSSPLNF